jgi:cytoskeletal protein CcmA (bactofilin family)
MKLSHITKGLALFTVLLLLQDRAFTQDSNNPDPTVSTNGSSNLPDQSIITNTPPLPNLAQRWIKESENLENKDVISAGSTVDNVFKMGRNVIIEGTVNGEVSIQNGQCFVLGTVNGSVSVTHGSLTVIGKVNGPVEVSGGDLRVAGEIKGSSDVVGGKILKTSSANIRGNITEFHLDGPAGKLLDAVIAFVANIPNDDVSINRHQSISSSKLKNQGFESAYLPFLFLWKVFTVSMSIIFPIILILIWPGHFLQKSHELKKEPLKCGAIGVLYYIGYWSLVLCAFFLSLMLIGLPFLGLLLLIDVCLIWYGYAVLYSWVGQMILRKFRGVESSVLFAFLAGAAILCALSFVPYLGFSIGLVGRWIAAGVAVLAVIRHWKRSIAATPSSLPAPVSAPSAE